MSPQCEMLDSNGDGIVTNTDKLFHLSNFGTSETLSDFDENGLVDVIDIFTLFGNMGLVCSEPLAEESFGNVVGLVLEEYFIHEVDISDSINTIPAGSITYRLYIETSTALPETIISGCFGNMEFPLQISTSTQFFQSQIGEECFLTTSQIKPLFLMD